MDERKKLTLAAVLIVSIGSLLYFYEFFMRTVPNTLGDEISQYLQLSFPPTPYSAAPPSHPTTTYSPHRQIDKDKDKDNDKAHRQHTNFTHTNPPYTD